MKPPWRFDKTKYEDTINYINKLQWWDEVPQRVRDDFGGDPSKVWSPHPTGFVRHLKELLKAAEVIS
jgi:hypothetical protein